MPRETVVDSRQEILRTAARLFQQRGYDATSMNDVAAALKLSKGGLYHHFQSKDEILFEIMNHAMEITQQRVIDPVRGIADPEERLRIAVGAGRRLDGPGRHRPKCFAGSSRLAHIASPFGLK